MRTTLTIDDDILAAARHLAQRDRKTVGKVVSMLARQGLTRTRTARSPVDPAHVQHDQAHDWFARAGRHAFATCPLTESGLIRTIGHPRYPDSPGPPGSVLPSLAAIRRMPGHAFWPDDISIADDELFAPGLLTSPSRVTDSYLLALARAHGGRLATMDRKLAAEVVPGGRKALELIPAR